MRILLFISIWALTFAQSVQAQDVCEGFENSCSDPAFAFLNGCFPDWGNPSGSPDVYSSQVSPAEGSQYVHMYNYWRGSNCGNNSTANRSEGVLLNYNFIAGETYEITYALQWTSMGFCHNASAQWILTDGLADQTGTWQSCAADGGMTPAIPAGSEVIQTHNTTSASNGWSYFTVPFTPNSNHSQLWLRLEGGPNTGCSSSGEASNRVYLDDFKLLGCNNEIETTSIWPRECVLHEFTIRGEYVDCAPYVATSVELRFCQDGAYTGVSVNATVNSDGTWNWSNTMQSLVAMGLDFGECYDVKPVMNLSNNTSVIGEEFVVGQNNDMCFADQSDPIVIVNDDPDDFSTVRMRFCEGDEIYYHGTDPLSGNHFSSIKRKLSVGPGNFGEYQSVGWVGASLDGYTGDLQDQYPGYFEAGYTYQLKLASYNDDPDVCIAWTEVFVEFEVVDCCTPDFELSNVPECVDEGEEITVTLTIYAPLSQDDIESIYSAYNNYQYTGHTYIDFGDYIVLEINFINLYCTCEGEMLVFDVVLRDCKTPPIWVMTDHIPCCAYECDNVKIVDWNAEDCIILNGNPARKFCIEVESDQPISGGLEMSNNATCQVSLHNIQVTDNGNGQYSVCGVMEFTDPNCTYHATISLILETPDGCCAISQGFSFIEGCDPPEECQEIEPNIEIIYVLRGAAINISLDLPQGETVTVIDHTTGGTQTLTVGTVRCGLFGISPDGTIVGGSQCNGIVVTGPEGLDCRSVEGQRPSIPYYFEIRWGDCVWIITGDYCSELIVYPLPFEDSGKRSSDVETLNSGQAKVFPNPVNGSGVLNFDLSEFQTGVNAIQISDVYGKTIESITPGEDQSVFQHRLAQPLHQGMYFVIFHLADGQVRTTNLVAIGE